MARTRAVSLDIKTDALVGKDKDNFDFEFIKDLDIKFQDLEFLDNQEISKFDKNINHIISHIVLMLKPQIKWF